MIAKRISIVVFGMALVSPLGVDPTAAGSGPKLEAEVLALAAGDARPWHRGHIDGVPLELRFVAQDGERVTVEVRRDLDAEARLEGVVEGRELALEGAESWRLLLDGASLTGSAERPGEAPGPVDIDLGDVRARVMAAHGLTVCDADEAGCVMDVAHGIAAAIEEPILRADALGGVTAAAARLGMSGAAGWLRDAATAAAAVEDPWLRASALGRLLAVVGQGIGERVALLEQAVAAARSVPFPGSRAHALAELAEQAGGAGLVAHAAALSDEALESAREAAGPASQAWALAAVAAAKIRLERPPQALATIGEAREAVMAIATPDERARALLGLQALHEGVGFRSAAAQPASEMADTHMPRAELLLAAAEGLVRSDPIEAQVLLDEALALAPAIDEAAARVEIWSRIAVALARCGQRHAALSTALGIETAGHLVWALTEIAPAAS
jgi:hypothetical protein